MRIASGDFKGKCFRRTYSEPIAYFSKHHQAFQQVVAIRTLAGQMQKQIDLSGCVYGDYGVFSVLAAGVEVLLVMFTLGSGRP
jgi:hypothetical protein